MTGRAEVYVYMHSRGLFAGAAVEGTRLDVDEDASAAFYAAGGGVPLGQMGSGTPTSVIPFIEALSKAAVLPPPAVPPGVSAAPNAPSQSSSEGAVTFPLE